MFKEICTYLNVIYIASHVIVHHTSADPCAYWWPTRSYSRGQKQIWSGLQNSP